jgi:Protein of unknown function (DUF3592)
MKKPMKNLFQLWLRVFGLACLTVGPCFLFVALGCGIRTELFIRHAVKVDGKVVQLTPVQGENQSVTYAPTFQFKSENGTLHSVTSNSGSNPAGFAVGQTIPVFYKSTNPSSAVIASFWQLWIFTFAFGIAGIMALGGGLGLSLSRRRRKPQVTPAIT